MVNWFPSTISSVPPSTAENVSSSFSTSNADREIVSSESSFTTWSLIESITGGSLTGITSSVKLWLRVNSPSNTCNVISTEPYQFSSVVKTTSDPTNSIPISGIDSPLKNNKSPSTSKTSNVKTSGSSSLVVWFEISENTGLSFIGLTPKINSVVLSSEPSKAITVTVKLPLKSESGVIVNIWPSISTWALSTSTLNDTSSPSTSLAESTRVRKLSSSIFWVVISEITGKSFTDSTSIETTPTSDVHSPSLTVNKIASFP